MLLVLERVRVLLALLMLLCHSLVVLLLLHVVSLLHLADLLLVYYLLLDPCVVIKSLLLKHEDILILHLLLSTLPP